MSRNKVTKLAFAIVVVSFLLSTFVALWSLNLMNRRNMSELSRMMAARINDTISGELNEPITVALTMANDSFLVDTLKNERRYPEAEIADLMRTYLSGIKDGLGYEAAFVISDESRRYYSYNGLSKTIDPAHDSHDLWYAAFLEKKEDYSIDVDNDELSHDAWTVFVDAAIRDGEGRYLGVCGVGVHMRISQELFYSLEKEYRVKISLVDPTGLIQVDTDESRIENETLDTLHFSKTGEYVYRELGGRSVVSKYLDRLGWYLVVESDGSTERGELYNVVLLNLGLCLFVMVVLFLAVRIIAMRTIALANASFRDQDTGLLNRRAFEEEKAMLQLAPLEEEFVYVTVDINGLKTANDTLGHAAGDELIRGAADCLRKSLAPWGKVYRIGGDEFAAMLHASAEQLSKLTQELEEATAAWSGERVKSLSLSYGVASAREFPSETVTELSRISDERMYKAKAEYYKKNGIDRRKT